MLQYLAEVPNVTVGIDSRTVFQDLEMDVRGGSPSGTAHQGNNLASGNVITGIHCHFLAMRVTGPESVSMIDFHCVAVAGPIGCPNDHDARKASNAAGSKNNHSTVKPVDLMAYLVRLVTPKGGLVLDPFCGSGSTGMGCVQEGMKFVGIELDASYSEIARRRIAAWQASDSP